MNISQADPPIDPDSHSGSGDESTPRWVKVFGIIAITAHITSSVGWLGAVAAFLALAVAGLTSQDVQLVRAALPSVEYAFVCNPVDLLCPIGETGIT